MELACQRKVASEPTIRIGRRTFRRRDGSVGLCRTWYARWCYRGQQHGRTLRTRQEEEAVERALALRIQILTPEDVRLQSGATFPVLMERYLDYQRKRNHAPRTVEKYDLVLRELCRWAAGVSLHLAADFGEDCYWTFHRWMLDAGLGDKTRYDRLVVVKQVFKWAARTRLIRENPIQAADLIRKPATPPQPCFSPEQVGKLLATATGQTRAIYFLMAYAGLRFGEVRDLQWDDLLWDQGRGGFLLVRRGGSNGTTKSGRHRRIPIHPRLRVVLREMPRKSGLVFRDPAGRDSLILERKLLAELKEVCERCGLPGPEQYKLHTFRHAFASMCARNNIAFKYALTWLGHRRSDVLDMYYQMFDPTAEEAIRTIDYEQTADPEYFI